MRARLDAIGRDNRTDRAEAKSYLPALLHFSRGNLTDTFMTGTRHPGAVR